MSRRQRFATIGFLGGLMGGLLGVGGGLVMVPLQVVWAGMTQKQANATSLVAIIPIAIAALPIYYFHAESPQVDLHMALFLVIGSVVGAYAGARLLKLIPERILKMLVAAMLVLVGIKEVIAP